MNIDLTDAAWFKSSRSNGQSACVEAARNFADSVGIVPVRDSKDLQGPALPFSVDAFTSFVFAVQHGEFGGV